MIIPIDCTLDDETIVATMRHAAKKAKKQSALDGCEWRVNLKLLRRLSKIKMRSTGRYLWRSGLHPGAADTMLGIAVQCDERASGLFMEGALA